MNSIKTSNLFSIATSGVAASNKLLQTTSNNIANINTQGYVRERTELTTQLVGGVGFGSTERVINQFAQNQMRRDTTEVGEWTIYDENKITLLRMPLDSCFCSNTFLPLIRSTLVLKWDRRHCVQLNASDLDTGKEI